MARFTAKQLRVSSSNEDLDVRLNNEIPIKMTDVVKNEPTRVPTAPYIIKCQGEKRVRMEYNASFTKNDKIPIKMTDVVKKGPHGPGGPYMIKGQRERRVRIE
jgi:hypothetical protein